MCALFCACGNDRHGRSSDLSAAQAGCVSDGNQGCDIGKSDTSPSAAESDGLTSVAVRQFFQEDTHRNVGKPLPAGIGVLNRNNDPVDLRVALAGEKEPIILLRVEPGCPPCKEALDYVRSNPQRFSVKHGARLAVIEVQGTKGALSNSSEIPEEFLFFKSQGKLDTGFLAGHISPAVFFFDKNLKLVARRAGLTTPQALFPFPGDVESHE